MKASDLISELKRLINEHNDLNVFISAGSEERDVAVETAEKDVDPALIGSSVVRPEKRFVIFPKKR